MQTEIHADLAPGIFPFHIGLTNNRFPFFPLPRSLLENLIQGN